MAPEFAIGLSALPPPRPSQRHVYTDIPYTGQAKPRIGPKKKDTYDVTGGADLFRGRAGVAEVARMVSMEAAGNILAGNVRRLRC